MKIQAIKISDLNDPLEVQTWLDDNTTISLHWVQIENNVFYIFYE